MPGFFVAKKRDKTSSLAVYQDEGTVRTVEREEIAGMLARLRAALKSALSGIGFDLERRRAVLAEIRGRRPRRRG